MSLATFKKKTINKYSTATKRSGKPPGGFWLPQGPFGKNKTINSVMLVENIKHMGAVGFSLNGSRRSISVGKDMKFSKNGTPFRGIYPRGNGGHIGRYVEAEPLLNAGYTKIDIRGNQEDYVKPSVLSTKGMLEQKYKWINNGQYPNNWVQPNYTGNQTDSASQGLYVQTKSAQNDCIVDTNDEIKYEDHVVSCGPFGCHQTPAKGYTFNLQQSNAPYTKSIRIPQTASQHTLRIQRRCANPLGSQKPYPYRVQTGTGIQTGGINVSHVGSACNTSNTTIVPPEWYYKNP
jgi:hypothetical protein